MAVPGWVLKNRNLKAVRGLRGKLGRLENKEDAVYLDFDGDKKSLMKEILTNICRKHGISNGKRLNYLKSYVELLLENEGWTVDTFDYLSEEILCCLRVTLVQDNVQLRAAGLRAIRYTLRNEEDVIYFNKLHISYLVSRGLDLVLKSDNDRILMCERMQALRIMRHILFIAPQHFSEALVRPLISAVLRPPEETDRLLRACLAVLCELCILKKELFIQCGGVTGLLRNLVCASSSHMSEAMCGCLLYLLDKPCTRNFANIDFHFLASTYTNISNSEKQRFREEERKLMWTNGTLLSLLRSWPGLMHFCTNFGNSRNSGLKTIIDSLYLNRINTRKAIIDLLFDVIQCTSPDWTNDAIVALESIKPSRFQDSYRLTEGFVAAEGRNIIPSLSKNRVNLVDAYRSLMLYCLLRCGVTDALVEVIVTADVFLSIRATILLGEILDLCDKLVPSECCVPLMSLSNLVSYACRGMPLRDYEYYELKDDNTQQESSNNYSYYHDHSTDSNIDHSSFKEYHHNPTTTDDDANLTSSCVPEDVPLIDKTYDYNINDNSISNHLSILNIKQLEAEACKHKQDKALSAISTLCNLQKIMEQKLQSASIHFACVIYHMDDGNKCKHKFPKNSSVSRRKWKTVKHKIGQMLQKECEELIKETGVLAFNDAVRWKWAFIRMALKMYGEAPRKVQETSFKNFVKRLIEYYKPSSKQYCQADHKIFVDKVDHPTVAACELLEILLEASTIESTKLVKELLQDIDEELTSLTDSESVYDSLISPYHVTHSLSQDYFVIIGRLTSSPSGLAILTEIPILHRLHLVATSLNFDCYAKLVVSSLSYVSSEITRSILSGVMICKYISSRLYATRYAHMLLRTNTSKHMGLSQWLIEILIGQLYDETDSIRLAALTALDEAADNKDYLKIIVKIRPSLLHMGEKGLMMLIRFLSIEDGFLYLEPTNFVNTQLQAWGSTFNKRYVHIVEGELHEALTHYQREDDGPFRQRVIGVKHIMKDVYLPIHLYGQLVQHQAGFNILKCDAHLQQLLQIVMNDTYDTDTDILNIKSALWAIGHISLYSNGASYLFERNIMSRVINLANDCPVYSIKATAFYVTSIMAMNNVNVKFLRTKGWCSLLRECEKCEIYSQPVSKEQSISEEPSDIQSPFSPDSDTPTHESNLWSPDEFPFQRHSLGRNSLTRKSVTLPNWRNILPVQHNRSSSESKATEKNDDWSLTDSPSSNIHKFIQEISASKKKVRCDSIGTDSSTSGVSSSDSIYVRAANVSEMIHTLSPIASTSSSTTMLDNNAQKDDLVPVSKPRSNSISSRLSALNGGYRTVRILQSARHTSSSTSISASVIMDLLSQHDTRQMSPLIRPKFSKYLQSPTTPEFEVMDASSIIGNVDDKCNEDNTSSLGLYNTEAITGPKYKGISLPINLSKFFQNSESNNDSIVTVKQMEGKHTDNEEILQSVRSKLVNLNNRKRRHEKSICLYCSGSELSCFTTRKPSCNSINRIRTETESSHGGLGGDTEGSTASNLLQKSCNMIDVTSADGASSSTTDAISVTHRQPNDGENSVKSRSILRKEVLKLVEQLANPVLYKTCKVGLLQLKQMCGDLFRDICIFSDVCDMLATISYRIQARQFIQDLFLDAPFYELHEEPLRIIENVTAGEKRNQISDKENWKEVIDETKVEDAKSELPIIEEGVAAPESLMESEIMSDREVIYIDSNFSNSKDNLSRQRKLGTFEQPDLKLLERWTLETDHNNAVESATES